MNGGGAGPGRPWPAAALAALSVDPSLGGILGAPGVFTAAHEALPCRRLQRHLRNYAPFGWWL